MKFSMTGQEKGDLLMQVTAGAGLTVFLLCWYYYYIDASKILSFLLSEKKNLHFIQQNKNI